MDWLDSMATYAQSQAPNDGGPADEEDEDFYGYSHGSGMNGVHKNGTARSDTVTGAAGADTNHTVRWLKLFDPRELANYLPSKAIKRSE